MGEEKRKEKIRIALKKAGSLLGRELRMLEEDEYCIDIMQQNLAVMGLLRSAHGMMMERHLRTCFKEAVETGSDKKREEMIEEILKVASLFNR